jgi:secreted PhoX family phosphatase
MGKLGKYESFAYDNETKVPTFYSTRDGDAGLITRFTPNQKGYECYSQLDDYDRWCTLEHGNIDYLITNQDGSIEWTTDLNRAMTNSERFHTNVEGINVHHGVLYFTAKEDKVLFTVNLRAKTYKVKSTVSRGFEEQPDQIIRIKGDESGDLYFCEDGGHHPGLHVMKKSGQMYTVLEADKRLFRDHKEETTGVATSPDAKHLYVSFQHVGRIYDVTRDDGRPFTGDVLRVKHHNNT